VLLKNKATLFIVATPIGNLSEMSTRAIDTLKNVDVIACEDTRNTIKLLTHFDIHTKMITYHNFNEESSTKGIIKLLNEDKSIALISDAGYPLISDPGYELVNSVIDNGFDIVVVSGPNAALNALVASGLNTNHYLFYGFLNSKLSHAKKELEELMQFPHTLIFYEAPHRIEKTLELMKEVFGNRKACLARELTKLHEQYHRGNLDDLCKLHDLKGEMVLVVEGYQEEDIVVDDIELVNEIKKLIKAGEKSKSAISMVSDRYNVSKNTLYDLYLKNKGE